MVYPFDWNEVITVSENNKLIVEHHEIKERPLHVTLVKGASGVYRWEISYHAYNLHDAKDVLATTDYWLAGEYEKMPEEK